MHHSESRRIWMEDDKNRDTDVDAIEVEFEGMGDEPARTAGMSFDDLEREVAAIPSDLDPPKPLPRPKHAMLPPPLPKPPEVEAAPHSLLTPPSTRDLASMTVDETFSFPPPTIQSVAPVELDTISQMPPAPSRVKATYVVGATALMAVLIVLMFASWGKLTAPDTTAWSANWKPPAPAAAAPVADPGTPHYFALDPVEVLASAGSQSPPAVSTAARSAARAVVDASEARAAVRAQRTSARLALDDVLQPARTSCREEGMAAITARVTATFGAEGRVMDVVVDVPDSAGEVGGCLAVAARRARIDAFDGEAFQVTRTIKVH